MIPMHMKFKTNLCVRIVVPRGAVEGGGKVTGRLLVISRGGKGHEGNLGEGGVGNVYLNLCYTCV